MEATQDRRRLILIIVVVVLLVCLVGVLLFNVFRNRGGGDDVAGGEPPTATVAPTEAPTEEPTEKATSTPTPVIEEEEPAPEPTEEVDSAAKEPTPTVPPTKTPTITADAGASTTVKMVEVEVTKIDEVLKNGDFEEGFGEDGVGQGWQSFKTGSAVINFSPETAEPFVHSGSSAQRISIDQAYEADQYGGIFQTVEVIPGKTYTVTLHGQIRSGFGSVEASSYGYRIQMAIDHAGTQFWRSVTTTNWIELPWPEQPLDSPAVTFSDYSLEIVPQSKNITFFIRGWSKWPNAGLAEYTLDSMSIVGPVATVELVAVESSMPGTEESTTPPAGTASEGNGAAVDKPLPVTGNGDDNTLWYDPRFWGATLVLLLLATGAVYRARWYW